MKIVVRDNLGKDVTHEREWYINTDGKIFYYTGDIDAPLYVVDNDYTFEMICPSAVTEEYLTNKYPFIVIKEVLESLPRAEADRIRKAVEETAKYMRR